MRLRGRRRRALGWPAVALWLAVLGCAGSSGSGGQEKLAAAPAITVAASNPARAPERVLLVSVAGLQPEHYGAGRGGTVKPNGAPMPNLARLAAGGAYADAMIPVLPAAPYPVHATLVTGLLPTHHQVLGDELMGPQGLYAVGISRESRIRGIPLWRAAQASGHASAALNWPLTQGADVALLMPDMGVPEREPTGTWFELLSGEASPWIVDRLTRLDPDLAQVPWPTTARRDRLVEQLACEIARQPVTPDLWLLAFEGSGTALARDGPGTDGARLGLARVDAAIGRVLECLSAAGLADSTAVVVVGDRALFPIHSVVYPNAKLEDIGLITPLPMHLGVGIASWDAFVRSYGGAAVVYAEREEDALLARSALEEQARATRAFHIVPATQLMRLHADPQAWFGLEGEPGYGIGKSARGPAVAATQRRGLGGFLPDKPGSAVGFVAWGAGIRPGLQVPRLSQIDVAPTVAALLGFELPGADGSPLIGILGRSGGSR